jgi:hypothetical protein
MNSSQSAVIGDIRGLVAFENDIRIGFALGS